jgi:hypothetical protein
MISLENLETALNELKANIKDGLLMSDIWDRNSGLTLAGYNSNPAAAALLTQVFNDLEKLLSASGYPRLRRYFFVELTDNKAVIVIPHSDNLLQGILVDTTKTNIGVLLAIALPRMLATLAAPAPAPAPAPVSAPVSNQGERLTDLALNAVELIDRNLYERSCDVRWWATDSAVVEALEKGTAQAYQHASSRLATILRSYTVYLDLFILDKAGNVVVCGRPERYNTLVGRNMGAEDWFSRAMRTQSGDEYVVADVARVPALGNAQAAIYATAIRAGGQALGETLGVLGIAFDWAPQAEAIVKGVRLTDAEKEASRVMLLDSAFRVLAASDGAGLLSETYQLTADGPLGFYKTGKSKVAYALTPGYETYEGMGWYGVIETTL